MQSHCRGLELPHMTCWETQFSNTTFWHWASCVLASLPEHSLMPVSWTCLVTWSLGVGSGFLLSDGPPSLGFLTLGQHCALSSLLLFLALPSGRLVPQPVMAPMPPALKVWSLTHWISRKVPLFSAYSWSCLLLPFRSRGLPRPGGRWSQTVSSTRWGAHTPFRDLVNCLDGAFLLA